MGGFLMVGILVAFVAGLGAIFFEIPAVADRLRRLRDADVGPHPVRDQQHHPRRQTNLHHG